MMMMTMMMNIQMSLTSQIDVSVLRVVVYGIHKYNRIRWNVASVRYGTLWYEYCSAIAGKRAYK